ncbi:alpha/beta hydrolase [Flavobacterium rhizosphaerae]|uniref:Alpha/beta hydrolase-fold protein n=1 Tax=Flavobacterium rhizosphaerae TaxID=3163298 RepID=A0ABW8YXL0_9FLAO
MKNKLLLLFLMVSFAIHSQQKYQDIESTYLGGTRQIVVYLPPTYDADEDRKYPLLLLLDGEYLTDPFNGVMSYAEYWDELPEVVIVGVIEDDTQREMDTQYAEGTGVPFDTGDRFFQFVSAELMPYIEKNYRISPFKIIGGHDVTAGYINFFLYQGQPAFNAYIAIAPELAPEMENRVPQVLSGIKKNYFYYLASAGDDLPRLNESITQFAENIKGVNNPKLNFKYDVFPDASHYSVVPEAISNALYHIFSAYKPITTEEYANKILTLNSGFVTYLEDKYNTIENELGVKIPIRINDFKAIEAAILKTTMYEELKDLARLAKKSYPKKTIGEYYEGLYYEKTGKLSKARKIYLNSYSYEEIADYTKDMMIERAQSLPE